MRCSANGASLWHKVTFSPEKTVPQAEPTPHQSAGADSFPSRGSQGWGRAARFAERTSFAPNTETFSAVYPISVGCSSRLARFPGGLGGRSRIEFIVSPLSRRRHNESHFAAQSPECAFLRRFRVSGFCLRSFARAKNGVNLRRRSRKISVESHPPDKRQG